MFGLVQYLCISFDFISLPNSVSISTRLEEPVDRLIIFSKSHRYGYNGYEHAWAGPPERTNWSIDEIIYTIKLNSEMNDIIPKIFVIPHLEKFQIGQFKLYAKLNDYEIQLTHRNRNFSDFVNQYDTYDYIIAKSGDNCSYLGEKQNIENINKFFNQNQISFTAIDSFILPDNSIAIVYKNKSLL